MRQSKYITIITMACALFFASCSDEYMENMNTDPSKLQLTFFKDSIQYRTTFTDKAIYISF